MLHILFLILKIIGIILAVILGILLLLACIVLFVPVCYKAEAKSEGTLEDVQVHGQISWLFGLIRAVVQLRGKTLDYSVRIAWKKLGARPESVQERRDKGEDEDEKREQEPETFKAAEASEEIEEPEGSKEPETLPENPEKIHGKHERAVPLSEEKPGLEEEAPEDAAEGSEKEQEDDEREHEDRPQKLPFLKKIKHKISEAAARLRQLPGKFKCTTEKICGKIKETSGKKDKLTAFITEPSHVNTLKKGKNEVLKLLGRIAPKVSADIHYGFEDPSLTGKILAFLGILYPFLGNNMQVTPDFQEKVLEGNLHVKGRIYVAHLAAAAVNLLLSKDVRRTIKDVKNFQL